MPDLPVTIVLPSGGARTAEVPRDVIVRELLGELTSLLSLPTVGPDGRPMGYRLDSKALGRELKEDETLEAAGVPSEDRLILSADITAGGGYPPAGGGHPPAGGSHPPAGGSGTMLSESPRIRRLRADYERMRELEARSDLIRFQAFPLQPGWPAERYLVTFTCKGIVGIDRKGLPKYGEKHEVEIYLHNQYPQRWPGMKWLTPIWHPNIHHANGTVCIDAAWWTASRSLDRLVVMLGEMVEYRNFHDDPTQPPFPWDPEAARWSRSYRAAHPSVFPVDRRELLRPERVKVQEENVAAKKPRIRLK